MLMTTTQGTPRSAALRRRAFWLCRKFSHQCSTTNSGMITVTVWLGLGLQRLDVLDGRPDELAVGRVDHYQGDVDLHLLPGALQGEHPLRDRWRW